MIVKDRALPRHHTWSRLAWLLLPVLPLSLGAVGCAGLSRSDAAGATAPAGGAPPLRAVVAEAYESAHLNGDNVDSLAVWGSGGWLLATAKSSDSVLVLDVATGALIRRVGTAGAGPGQFKRPNGITVVDDLLVVVERDNRRVQVISLPDLTTVGLVGEGVLRFPYGVTAFASGAGRYELYVTDSYQGPEGEVPPDAELGERVRHFRVERDGAGLRSTLVQSFGDTAGEGALHVVESIAADPLTERLLVADEAAGYHDIKVYSLGGRFTGEVLGRGLFQAEPEGIALVACGDGGFWVTTDQQKARTIFYLLDRTTFTLRGSFTGRVVANTDGIVTAAGAVRGFPAGALFAVHDDISVAAFAWPAIAEMLGLHSSCRTSS